MTSTFCAPLGRLSLVVTLGLTAACTAETGEDISVESDELRALTNSEVVGTISANQTVRVNYEPIPRYRALSFSGKAGDEVTIAVHGLGKSDPIAFLLSDAYRTLDRNDNESTSSRDSLIMRKLTKTGTYYVAVREVDEETSPKSKFDVTLTTSATTPPSADPFDPASCTGPALSVNALVAKIPKGKLLKDYSGVLSARFRECTKVGGCAAWSKVEVVPEVADVYQQLYAADIVALRLQLPPSASAPPEAGIFLRQTPHGYVETEEVDLRTPYNPTGKNHVSSASKGTSIWSKFTTPDGTSHEFGTDIEFDLTLRDTCFRAISKNTTENEDFQRYEELEYAFLGTY